MYSIVCVSLSYDTRNVFSLFSVKYMGSCPLNRKVCLRWGSNPGGLRHRQAFYLKSYIDILYCE